MAATAGQGADTIGLVPVSRGWSRRAAAGGPVWLLGWLAELIGGGLLVGWVLWWMARCSVGLFVWLAGWLGAASEGMGWELAGWAPWRWRCGFDVAALAAQQ